MKLVSCTFQINQATLKVVKEIAVKNGRSVASQLRIFIESCIEQKNEQS